MTRVPTEWFHLHFYTLWYAVISSSSPAHLHHTATCQSAWTDYIPVTLCFFLFSRPPLGVCSAKRRHQSPEWTILSRIIALFRERLLDFRTFWIVFIRIVRGRPGGLLQFDNGEAVKIFLVTGSCIGAVCPNGEKRRSLTIAGWWSCRCWLCFRQI